MISIHNLATRPLSLLAPMFGLLGLFAFLPACPGQATSSGQDQSETAAATASDADAAAETATATASDADAASAPPATPTGPVPCVLELWDAEKQEWTLRDKLQCPADGKLRLLSAGDMGRAGEPLNKSVAGMQRACAEKDCQLLLMPGDLVYGPGTKAESSWRRAWDEGLARLGLPALAVLGNHEYRHEPDPKMKRDVLYASDKHLRLVLPAAHYAARLVAGDKVLLALAGLDTDSLASGGTQLGHPGLGITELFTACREGAPVVVLGHHPPSSQGYHHIDERAIETLLRSQLVKRVAAGCNIVVVAAGHDHDLQAYGPGCEEAGAPAVVVAGATARGYRKRGSTHLATCPASDAQSSYHAGLGKQAGGFAILDLDLAAGQVAASLVHTPEMDQSKVLGVVKWQFSVP